jgi:Kdo2-lipid IVA lauroyltransferase/acyltransferase
MQRLAFILLYPILWLISLLPLPVLYMLSDMLYGIVYYVIGYRKKVVKDNLRLVFPEKSTAEINTIAKQFFRHLCDMMVETIKSLTISQNELNRRFRYKNLDVLEDLHARGKSALLMSGHYASWEWSGNLAQLSPFEAFAVYKKIRNPYFDALVKRIRGRFGGTIVPNTQITKALYRKFKEGTPTLTLILSDQTPKQGSFKNRQLFLGFDVPVFTGTEELAKLLDFTALYFKITKLKRGYYEAEFILLTENPKEIPDFQLTRMFLDEIENQIHEAPQYYLWSHKRWKHRL